MPVPTAAALMALVWAAVRLLMRADAPARSVVMAGRFRSIGPTAAQVPSDRVTGRLVAADTFCSLRTIQPVPVL